MNDPSLSDTDDKQEVRKKKPPRRRLRKQVPANESSDDDGFSSTNTASRSRYKIDLKMTMSSIHSIVVSEICRSKSVDTEKKRRGRPRKDPLANVQPPKTTPNKKETIKKPNPRTRNGRSNSTVKSREMLSTDSSSGDEDTPEKRNVRLPIISPRNNNKKLTNRNLEELSAASEDE